MLVVVRHVITNSNSMFQDKIAKMRMREENYYKVWNNVVNYYDSMDVKTKSHSKWASNDFFVQRYVLSDVKGRAKGKGHVALSEFTLDKIILLNCNIASVGVAWEE